VKIILLAKRLLVTISEIVHGCNGFNANTPAIGYVAENGPWENNNNSVYDLGNIHEHFIFRNTHTHTQKLLT
jgi:hypothetical protein